MAAVDVANSALVKLGARTITALTDNKPTAEACNERIDDCRKTVLRAHPWNFAVDRRELTLAAVTNVVNNGSGLCRVTVATHGFSTGNKVSISGVLGSTEANGTWTITVIDPNTFDLVGSVFNNTYVSGGVAGLAPAYGWTFKHALPTDSLRLLHVNNDSGEWRREGDYILANEDSLEVQIIQDVTDYDEMDPDFLEALAYYLAWEICYRVTQNQNLKAQMLEDYGAVVRRARFVESTEDSPKQIEAEDWLDARVSGAGQFVRDPMT